MSSNPKAVVRAVRSHIVDTFDRLKEQGKVASAEKMPNLIRLSLEDYIDQKKKKYMKTRDELIRADAARENKAHAESIARLNNQITTLQSILSRFQWIASTHGKEITTAREKKIYKTLSTQAKSIPLDTKQFKDEIESLREGHAGKDFGDCNFQSLSESTRDEIKLFITFYEGSVLQDNLGKKSIVRPFLKPSLRSMIFRLGSDGKLKKKKRAGASGGIGVRRKHDSKGDRDKIRMQRRRNGSISAESTDSSTDPFKNLGLYLQQQNQQEKGKHDAGDSKENELKSDRKQKEQKHDADKQFTIPSSSTSASSLVSPSLAHSIVYGIAPNLSSNTTGTLFTGTAGSLSSTLAPKANVQLSQKRNDAQHTRTPSESNTDALPSLTVPREILTPNAPAPENPNQLSLNKPLPTNPAWDSSGVNLPPSSQTQPPRPTVDFNDSLLYEPDPSGSYYYKLNASDSGPATTNATNSAQNSSHSTSSTTNNRQDSTKNSSTSSTSTVMSENKRDVKDRDVKDAAAANATTTATLTTPPPGAHVPSSAQQSGRTRARTGTRTTETIELHRTNELLQRLVAEREAHRSDLESFSALQDQTAKSNLLAESKLREQIRNLERQVADLTSARNITSSELASYKSRVDEYERLRQQSDSMEQKLQQAFEQEKRNTRQALQQFEEEKAKAEQAKLAQQHEQLRIEWLKKELDARTAELLAANQHRDDQKRVVENRKITSLQTNLTSTQEDLESVKQQLRQKNLELQTAANERSSFEQKMHDEITRHNREAAERLKRRENELESEFSERYSKMEQSLRDQLARSDSSHIEQLRQAEQEHSAQIAKLIQDLHAAQQQAELKFAQDLKRSSDVVSEQRQTMFQEQQRAYQSRIDNLQSEIKQTAAAHNEALQRAVVNATENAKLEDKIASERELRAKLEEQRNEYKQEIDALQSLRDKLEEKIQSESQRFREQLQSKDQQVSEVKEDAARQKNQVLEALREERERANYLEGLNKKRELFNRWGAHVFNKNPAQTARDSALVTEEPEDLKQQQDKLLKLQKKTKLQDAVNIMHKMAQRRQSEALRKLHKKDKAAAVTVDHLTDDSKSDVISVTPANQIDKRSRALLKDVLRRWKKYADKIKAKQLKAVDPNSARHTVPKRDDRNLRDLINRARALDRYSLSDDNLSDVSSLDSQDARDQRRKAFSLSGNDRRDKTRKPSSRRRRTHAKHSKHEVDRLGLFEEISTTQTHLDTLMARRDEIKELLDNAREFANFSTLSALVNNKVNSQADKVDAAVSRIGSSFRELKHLNDVAAYLDEAKQHYSHKNYDDCYNLVQWVKQELERLDTNSKGCKDDFEKNVVPNVRTAIKEGMEANDPNQMLDEIRRNAIAAADSIEDAIKMWGLLHHQMNIMTQQEYAATLENLEELKRDMYIVEIRAKEARNIANRMATESQTAFRLRDSLERAIGDEPNRITDVHNAGADFNELRQLLERSRIDLASVRALAGEASLFLHSMESVRVHAAAIRMDKRGQALAASQLRSPVIGAYQHYKYNGTASAIPPVGPRDARASNNYHDRYKEVLDATVADSRRLLRSR